MAVARWTDEMLDNLASSITEEHKNISDLRSSVNDLRSGVSDLRSSVTDVRESLSDVRDSVDGLRLTTQALLQVAAQSQRDMELMQQRQEENDQRFNVLLQEVRYLNRGNQAE